MEINRNLLSAIKNIITQSREQAARAVDHARVMMYWHIGEQIFEEEQQGKDRADYGVYLIHSLAKQLEPEFGSGFSRRQLELMRQFYRSFPIANTLYSQLSWTHYRLLIRLENKDKRDYCLAETVKNSWTTLQLERQINSQLFERLMLSNDKENRTKKGSYLLCTGFRNGSDYLPTGFSVQKYLYQK